MFRPSTLAQSLLLASAAVALRAQHPVWVANGFPIPLHLKGDTGGVQNSFGRTRIEQGKPNQHYVTGKFDLELAPFEVDQLDLFSVNAEVQFAVFDPDGAELPLHTENHLLPGSEATAWGALVYSVTQDDKAKAPRAALRIDLEGAESRKEDPYQSKAAVFPVESDSSRFVLLSPSVPTLRVPAGR